ncbi:glycogen synthase GlgA [Variovorax ginsengisoli]|uniref:Glycogen synthase n=1 Tax=Variovorax ginsengisoli TaxID=363844 RepID=A0ABT8S5G7_9BURK|nr:glycogen synthase GlgA [Variovorax ginsengisoli]MDN8614815.1 glycogen synthase GlgA [Variovorax ginsengisoli]MDO1533985.1 glycogen synthase GlgA [Variovorax ginsengisoli]
MRILQVSAELFPLLKTGGLADIAGALPLALMAAGQEARVLLPGFPAILAGVADAAPVAELTAPWGERARLLLGRITTAGAPDTPAYVIDAPALYDRPGNPYEDPRRQPYADNHRRFALLGWAAAQLAQGLDPGWQPDIVHAHDWHAALAPAYMAFAPRGRQPRAGSVFTVHNLAYQGLFAASHFAELGLPAAAFSIDGLEYHGQLSFMKGGLCFADRLTTVSPTYAREIQTPEQGCGLDGLLRSRAEVLTGILNAVDDQVWNPATDALIPHRYDLRRMTGKVRNKAALQEELGLAPQTHAPLFVLVSRLTEQKGLHLVLEGLDGLLAQGGQLALLGSGDAWLEAAFKQRAAHAPQSVSVTLGYSEATAHRLFGAGDVTLVPSLFEPCGLTQMYGLKYGSLPLVHRIGGLADTVVDATIEDLASGEATGFAFDDFGAEGYARAVRRAFALYQRPADWRAVRASAMRRPADWGSAAAQYLGVYAAALNPRPSPPP